MLEYLYKDRPQRTHDVSLGTLQKFSQSEFLETNVLDVTGIDPQGFVYFPYQCHEKRCRVHMHFHGCSGMVTGTWGHGWKEIYAGFMDFAAANDLIVVFP